MPATIIDSEDTAVGKYTPIRKRSCPLVTYILVEIVQKEVKETGKTCYITLLLSAVEKN